MNWFSLLAVALLAATDLDVPKGASPSPTPAQPAAVPPAPVVPVAPNAQFVCPQTSGCCVDWACCCSGDRGLFRSDDAFPRFIGPISNPILAKDPRSLTYVRALFINDVIPSEHPLGGGDFQAVAAQINVAVNERLTIIADKDGYAWLNPNRAKHTDGWLNIGLGLKYAFLRDPETQTIVSGGIFFEPQTGEANVFQGHGDGIFTFFLTAGQEFAERAHVLANVGYQLPVDRSDNSTFFYTSLHLDYQVLCWLYPLVELNWFHYTSGGNRGLPAALGEGDGLLNLGTTGVAGNDLVTLAVGARARLTQCIDLGAALEFPISNRRDLIDNRLLVDLIFRY